MPDTPSLAREVGYAAVVLLSMGSIVRSSRYAQGFEFSSDCPEHVKVRTIKTLLPKLGEGERLALPLCDQMFVNLVDETQRGWLIPFVGFVEDARVARRSNEVRQSLNEAWLRLSAAISK